MLNWTADLKGHLSPRKPCALLVHWNQMSERFLSNFALFEHTMKCPSQLKTPRSAKGRTRSIPVLANEKTDF